MKNPFEQSAPLAKVRQYRPMRAVASTQNLAEQPIASGADYRIEDAGSFHSFFKFAKGGQNLAPIQPGRYGTACLTALKPEA
jgi:hypothetical protein